MIIIEDEEEEKNENKTKTEKVVSTDVAEELEASTEESPVEPKESISKEEEIPVGEKEAEENLNDSVISAADANESKQSNKVNIFFLID